MGGTVRDGPGKERGNTMAQRQSTEDSSGTRTVPFRYSPGDGCSYVWHGGEYIEVFRVADILANPDAPAVDVINVWDYDTGAPQISRTASAFTLAVDDWRAAR